MSTTKTIPSSELIDMGAMSDLDRQIYTQIYANRFQNIDDQNALAQQLNLMSPDQRIGVGEWEGNLNPNIVTEIKSDPAKGGDVISEWSDEAVKFYGSLEGLIGGQTDVGYSYIRPAKKAG